jgi:hypothetical protein
MAQELYLPDKKPGVWPPQIFARKHIDGQFPWFFVDN